MMHYSRRLMLLLGTVITMYSCKTTLSEQSTASRSVKLQHLFQKKDNKTEKPTFPLVATLPLAPLPLHFASLPTAIHHVKPQYVPVYAAAAFPEEPCNQLRDSITHYAIQFLGRPYRHAAKGPKAFDCSGFTSFILGRFGYYLPPSSSTQAHFGTPIDIEDAQKGDLLFFGYTDKNKRYRVTHAALVISEPGEELRMIHAARRGITIDDINNNNWRSYYAQRLLFARRVIHDGVIPNQDEPLLGSTLVSP